MKHTVRGFTVVEILIVTAVIAIIAAISVVGYRVYRNEHAIRRAYKRLVKRKQHYNCYFCTTPRRKFALQYTATPPELAGRTYALAPTTKMANAPATGTFTAKVPLLMRSLAKFPILTPPPITQRFLAATDLPYAGRSFKAQKLTAKLPGCSSILLKAQTEIANYRLCFGSLTQTTQAIPNEPPKVTTKLRGQTSTKAATSHSAWCKLTNLRFRLEIPTKFCYNTYK